MLPLSSSPVLALGCSRGCTEESRRITGCRLSTAMCTLLTLKIHHATSTSIPWHHTYSPQMDRRLVVNIVPSVCQQRGIMPITSIRMRTCRNPISAGTWGQGLLGCQDSPLSCISLRAKALLSPVETPVLQLVYASHAAGYVGRGKH